MKLKKAIEILEKQKQKVLDPEYPNNDEWIVQTASYIKDFFGFDSTEYFRIANFKWSIKVINTTSKDDRKYFLKEKKENIVLFLDNCKQTLENKGLFKEPKSNLLSDKNNAELIGIIFTISSIIFGIGYYFGTEKTNNELIRTENKLIKLKDSLSSIKPFVYPKGMSDKEKKVTNTENNKNQ